ncbi:MAG: substrate-binding periplasmic protein, partial [Bryobacteraceae bacterium]
MDNRIRFSYPKWQVAACTMILVVMAALSSCQPKRAGSHAVRIGIRHSPPDQIVGSDGTPDGVAVQVLNEAAARAGVQLIWRVSPEGPDEAFETSAVDLWPVLAPNPERSRNLHFTKPWLQTQFTVISLQESGILSPDQLDAKRVAYYDHAVIREAAYRSLGRIVSVPEPDREGVLIAVCKGAADAGFIEARVA